MESQISRSRGGVEDEAVIVCANFSSFVACDGGPMLVEVYSGISGIEVERMTGVGESCDREEKEESEGRSSRACGLIIRANVLHVRKSRTPSCLPAL